METGIPHVISSLRKAIGIVALLWFAFVLQNLMAIDTRFLGIIPRTVHGLAGILFSPFTHGNLMHIVSNSLPLLVQLFFSFLFYPRLTWKVLPLLFVFTGGMVWLTGAPNSSHIGASGILYGITTFLFFSGLFRKDLGSLVISLLVAFLYGGMIWGIFPSEEGISYESHLFGALGGAILAYLFRRQDIPQPKVYDWEKEPDYHPRDDEAEWNYRKDFFPPRNVDEP